MIDSMSYRKVLGNYPTGVCVVTARGGDGQPCGMVIGSFTSVSLDPPLVGFLPGKNSGSWPLIENAGAFCINIFGSDQRALCQKLAAPGVDKFAGVSHSNSTNGSPLVDGVLAWIDCSLHGVIDAGDHWFVMGRVEAMEAMHDGDPLLFFRGKYGGFREIALDLDKK
jgi:3-hydroxy-9,10-secoandrosta-1,3,5(10)-triene-9,17-dione monooxygenase reductase component